MKIIIDHQPIDDNADFNYTMQAVYETTEDSDAYSTIAMCYRAMIAETYDADMVLRTMRQFVEDNEITR